ncbi:MAG: hypothetical protein H7A21_19190 [Spirochaetales bacterium]|nr:hypothetical protein [Leptospiraceae bacterium]MCP5483571.1 hypothetical protein [Spirochaetales bacterium]MCP5486425.1 hypothetical protein [Spirochaetales bacterium]
MSTHKHSSRDYIEDPDLELDREAESLLSEEERESARRHRHLDRNLFAGLREVARQVDARFPEPDAFVTRLRNEIAAIDRSRNQSEPILGALRRERIVRFLKERFLRGDLAPLRWGAVAVLAFVVATPILLRQEAVMTDSYGFKMGPESAMLEAPSSPEERPVAPAANGAERQERETGTVEGARQRNFQLSDEAEDFANDDSPGNADSPASEQRARELERRIAATSDLEEKVRLLEQLRVHYEISDQPERAREVQVRIEHLTDSP